LCGDKSSYHDWATSPIRNLPSHYLNVQIDAHIVMPLQHLDATIGLNHVKVIHCNDAKAARGSRLDRHQQIGKGTIGIEPFRILLNDLRLAHAAFIAETPIDQPGDGRRNVEALKKLVT
jgi:endonuclease IV